MVSARIGSVLKIIVVIYLAYLALVLLVATPLLNLLAPTIYRAQTGRELRVENIVVNPFALSVAVERAAGDNPDGSRFWSFDTLFADVSLSSLWHFYPILDEIRLKDFYLQVEQTAADRYNFTDILEHRAARGKQPQPEPEAGASQPLRLVIRKLTFNATHLGLHAPYLKPPLPMDAQVSDLDIKIKNLNTVPPRDLQLAADHPLPMLGMEALDFGLARFDFKSLRPRQPFETHLEPLRLTLRNFSTVAQAGQPYALDVQDEIGGQLRWRGDVSLAAAQSAGELQLQNISLLPAWRFFKQQLAFDAGRGFIDAQAHYQLNWREGFQYSIDQGRVALRELRTQARADKDSALNFGRFSVDGIRLDGAQRRFSAARVGLDGLALRGWNKDTRVSLADMFKLPPSAPDEEPAPPWQVDIAELAVRDGRIDWRASQIDAPLAVTPLELKVSRLSYPATGAAALDLKATVNKTIRLSVGGDLDPSELTGNLSGELNGLPLTWGNSLLGRQLTATLTSGTLGGKWQMQLDKGAPVKLQADGRIDKFELLRLPDRRRLLAWRQLQWQGLDVDLRAQRAALKDIELNEPWAQFRINPDGTNNFQQLAVAHAAEPAPAEQPAPQQDKRRAPKPAAKPAPAADGKPWLVTVDTIHPHNGTLDFRDNSMARPFTAKIGQFGGTVSGLSSRPNQAAKVDLRGRVDGYAPVTLTGTASPLAPKPSIDLALDFANLDLATLTPYSGTYAGFAIARGQLSVQLAYQLENDRIKGKNHIVVQQMQLGERVRSPKAVDLPLRLAIALLTDEHGVMDLGVDISGNLDDPQFDLGGIIWKAFRNLIVKAVTSPFRLLAGLISGGANEQLGEVDFAPGSYEIGPGTKDKLANLKNALEKRPALRLSVIGHVDPDADTVGLKQRTLDYQLRMAGIDPEDIRKQAKPWRKKIEEMYEDKFPDQKIGDQPPQQLANALRDSIELKPDQLATLAGERALAVKRILVVDLALPPDRIFINSEESERGKASAPKVTMQLDG